MENDMKCPLCGAQLKVERYALTYDVAVCPNTKCDVYDQEINIKVWQALISGKKAQDALNKVDLLLGHAKSCERNNIVVGGSTYRAIIQAIDLCRAEIASITKEDKE